MYYLIYVSSATKLMDNDELLSLLAQSRDKNLELDITGMLLYKGGNFMQMLEGDEQTVNDLYDTIVRDERHSNVTRVITGHIAQRNFQGWSMGFCNMDTVEELPGFQHYIEENLTLRSFADDAQVAYRILVQFNRDNR